MAQQQGRLGEDAPVFGQSASVIDAAARARPDRRADILTAAEMLFADRGYASVSIRDIAAEAAVPIALIRYAVGRKEDLLAFIFERHHAAIDQRIAAIEAVTGPPGPVRAARILRAWTEPVLRERATSPGNTFSTLVARSVWEAGDENRRIVERYYDPLARCFIAAMKQALPRCEEASIIWATSLRSAPC